jgi:hypothetical protein
MKRVPQPETVGTGDAGYQPVPCCPRQGVASRRVRSMKCVAHLRLEGMRAAPGNEPQWTATSTSEPCR